MCRLVVVRDGRVLFFEPDHTSRTIHALEVLCTLACPILLVELVELDEHVSESVSDIQTKNAAGKPRLQVIYLFLHLLGNVGILDDDLRESVVLGAKRLVLGSELRLLGAVSLVNCPEPLVFLQTHRDRLAVAGGPDCGGIQSSGDGIEMLLDGLVRRDGSFEMIVNNVVIERCELKIVNGDCDG